MRFLANPYNQSWWEGNSKLAVDLLVAAGYQECPPMETSMLSIIFGQDRTWFSVKSSLRCYWHAREKIVKRDEQDRGRWARLKRKAIWNLVV